MASFRTIEIPEVISPCKKCTKFGKRCRNKCLKLKQFQTDLNPLDYLSSNTDTTDDGYSFHF